MKTPDPTLANFTSEFDIIIIPEGTTKKILWLHMIAASMTMTRSSGFLETLTFSNISRNILEQPLPVFRNTRLLVLPSR